jgi:hypothetical protein
MSLFFGSMHVTYFCLVFFFFFEGTFVLCYYLNLYRASSTYALNFSSYLKYIFFFLISYFYASTISYIFFLIISLFLFIFIFFIFISLFSFLVVEEKKY